MEPAKTETTNTPTSELDATRAFYSAEATKMYEVVCNTHPGGKRVIALEVEIAGEPKRRAHLEGLIVVPIDDLLYSYRTRTNDTMGYSCACGATDILLIEERDFAKQDMTLPHVKAQIKHKLKYTERLNKPQNGKLFKRIRVK